MESNNQKNKKQRRSRRKFTEEFRADVVRLCRSGAESIGEVCKRLDLTESAVRGWVAKAESESEPGASTSRLTASELDELQGLRREVKQLRLEREILKNIRVPRRPTWWTRNSGCGIVAMPGG